MNRLISKHSTKLVYRFGDIDSPIKYLIVTKRTNNNYLKEKGFVDFNTLIDTKFDREAKGKRKNDNSVGGGDHDPELEPEKDAAATIIIDN